MSAIRHIFAVLLLASACSEGPQNDQTEKMSRIVAEMVVANQAKMSPDSLQAHRQALLTEHDVSEQQLRAWISRLKSDPQASAQSAPRVATLVDSLSALPPND